ncbi:MAG: hypothetical protein ACK5JN_06670, partial [Kluyvera sp.]|uniref:hypothetical protein n=1 Tax=Kluyvera sp. TaxID=1538228 RepID=UPI003A846B13
LLYGDPSHYLKKGSKGKRDLRGKFDYRSGLIVFDCAYGVPQGLSQGIGRHDASLMRIIFFTSCPLDTPGLLSHDMTSCMVTLHMTSMRRTREIGI